MRRIGTDRSSVSAFYLSYISIFSNSLHKKRKKNFKVHILFLTLSVKKHYTHIHTHIAKSNKNTYEKAQNKAQSHMKEIKYFLNTKKNHIHTYKKKNDNPADDQSAHRPSLVSRCSTRRDPNLPSPADVDPAPPCSTRAPSSATASSS